MGNDNNTVSISSKLKIHEQNGSASETKNFTNKMIISAMNISG